MGGCFFYVFTCEVCGGILLSSLVIGKNKWAFNFILMSIVIFNFFCQDLIFNAPFVFSFRNNLFFSGLQSHCSFLYFDLPNSLRLLVLFLMFVIFSMFDKNFLISLCLLIKYRIYGNFHDIRLERVNHFLYKRAKTLLQNELTSLQTFELILNFN